METVATLTTGLQKYLKKTAGKFLSDDKAKIEPYSKVYALSNEMRKAIAVHAQYGNFPKELMKAKAPNETPEELKYREENDESITKPYWDKGLSAVGRIWGRQNWSIDWADESEAKNYFTVNFPIHNNIISYFENIVTERSLADACSLVALHIPSIPTKEVDGELVADDSVEVAPMLKIYGSDRRIDFAVGEYALLLCDELSEVEFGGKKEKCGLVFYYYDTESIWRIYQTGKKTDWSFVAEEYYRHSLGYLPVFTVPGKQISDDSKNVVHESYFQAAVPFLNKARKLDSTNDAVIAKCSYPTRVYYERECTNPRCDGGWVEGEDKKEKCTSCKGTGKLSNFSPLRDYIHYPKEGGFKESDKIEFPGLTYVAPDSTIIESNDKRIEHYLDIAFIFANIDTTLAGSANGDETATKTRLDRDEMFAFLLRFSGQMFELLADCISAIYSVRYIRDVPETITIHPPVEFDLKTASELGEEVSALAKNGAPDVAVREVTKEFMLKRFPAQKSLERRTDIVFYCDPFVTKDAMQVSAIKAQGGMTPEQMILHFNINSWLDEKIEEDANYFSKPLPEIKKEMLALAATLVASQNSFSAEDILKRQAGGG